MKVTKKKGEIPYLERDISWMYFNRRILSEAEKAPVPLLERLSFLGIYSNNLDEFYRVRVATLNRIIEYEDKTIKAERETAIQTFREISRLNALYTQKFEETFTAINTALRQNRIYLLNEQELQEEQANYIREFYKTQLIGSTTPLFTSSFRHFSDQPDDHIYLSVCLQTTGKTKKDFAIIALPVQSYGRFIRIPGDDDRICLMFLDDIVRFCLPLIFNGRPYDHFEAYTFKFTKDAEMELDSDLRNSIMQKISKGVKSRKNGEPIRLVYDSRMPAVMQRHLSRMLCMDRWDTQVGAGRYQNLKDLMKFPDCKRDDLKYPPQPPLFKTDFSGDDSILNTIRTRDLFLHYPYHSFSSFLRVLREATIDPNVKAIKMTLYRVAKNSKVIQTLIAAARNGKKVTVVIELLARFDEASNISWSKQMQDAGIKVVFGVEGLKIHAKLVYISGRQGDIACVSTGNFHEGNATRYTDVTLFTARKTLVKEVRHVFDFIEKPYLPVKFKELLVSPNDMRSKLLKLIEEEVKNAKKQKPARILGKVNHITDRTLIAKLYEASAAGVKIDLVVRGNCSIVTGIPGISENIRINGIIDRYLEHSRIFIFENAGDMICLTGSADWMPRNLDNRIEVLTPVYDKEIQTELKRIVEYGLKDSLQGRQVDGTGQNIPWKNEDHSLFRSQSALYHYYQEDIQEITTNNIPHE